MTNLKRIIYLAIFIFICSSIWGCSKAVPISNSKSPLESWIGSYVFSEFAPPDKNMFYSISLYEDNNNYFATISIDGFQTIERLQAKVTGDGKTIKLIFDRYLPDNLYEPYKEGDILLSFEKKDAEIHTFWGEIQPMLTSNTKSDKVYFKKNEQ